MTSKNVFCVKIPVFLIIIKIFAFDHPPSKYRQVFIFLLKIISKLKIEVFFYYKITTYRCKINTHCSTQI